MVYYVKHQERYSRGQLLLRSLLGIIYIGIPHSFVLFFFAIGNAFVRFFTFWACLFTGKYPKSFWDYQVKFLRYQLRVNARLQNLADGYPEFGLNGTDQNTNFDIEYKENVSRMRVLGRTLFGPILLFPHVIVLFFRLIGVYFVYLIAFWVVLFTAQYPEGMFNFMVGTGRWIYRINCYLYFYTDNYPPFTGKELSE